MGYEKPSTKLTFYKAFFSTQWKFFIHTILHSLSAKRTSWNEFSSAMASALICLSSGQRFNFSKYIFESLVRNVDSTSKFYMYPRVGKGFSGVETPLFENMLVVRAVDAEEEVQVPAQDDVVQEHVIEELATEVVPPTPTSPSPSSPHVLDKCSALVLRVKGLETVNAAQQLEIIKLKARVKKLERLNKVKSSKLSRLKKVGTSQRVKSSEDVENVFNQGRISVDMDQDEGVELVVDQEKDAKIEGRHADTQAEIYNIDLDHSSKVLSMQEDTEVQEAVEVVTTAKLITEVVTAAATQVAAASTSIPAAKPKTLKIAAALAVSTRRRKRVVIRDPEEELHTDTPAETPTVKDKGKGILIEDPKPMKKKDQIEMDVKYAKKLQEELEKEHEEAYKQIDWNAAFDHVQAKETQEEMEKEDEEIIKSINETPAQKAAKRRKLSEEAQEADDLRRHLEIVQDEDDDVFVEAIPLAQKLHNFAKEL
nr:glutamic acid-rich protein-like [Tanacetum cinerariifolium]